MSRCGARQSARQVRIFSSRTDYCRASSFAPPSPAKKLLTTLSLNSVLYFSMEPFEVCPTFGGSSNRGDLLMVKSGPELTAFAESR